MNRTVMNITLIPVAGRRFQPTGFPDLGAATYQIPRTGQADLECLHLESPQSMANHLEAATWDAAAHDQASAMAGIPYVRVVDADGQFLTSSRLEAHRLASAYIMDGKLDGVDGRSALPSLLRLPERGFADHRQLAAAIFDLDPLSLIHGAFFAQKAWSSQPKIARAVSSFIDAEDIRVAVSGGVKTDSVSSKSSEGQGADAGYGMVPHSRIEYTAAHIYASVVIDHAQIRSYGLTPEREGLLNAIIDFELASVFRSGGLRLRTACDLMPANDADLVSIPEIADAERRLRAAIKACDGQLGEVREFVWASKAKASKMKAHKEEK